MVICPHGDFFGFIDGQKLSHIQGYLVASRMAAGWWKKCQKDLHWDQEISD